MTMNRLLVFAAFSVLTAAPTVTAQSASQSTPSPLPSPEAGTPAAKPDPERHLSDAQTRLAGVSQAALPADGKKKLSQLREDMTQLQAQYRSAPTGRPATASGGGSKDKAVAGSVGGSVGGSKEKSAADWNLKFSDVERDLGAILGAGSSFNSVATGVGTSVAGTTTPGAANPSTPSATGTPGAATTGAATSPAAAPAAGTVPGTANTAATTSQVPPAAGRAATTTVDAGDRVIVNGAQTLPGAPPAGSNPAGTGTAAPSQATGSPATVAPVGSAQVAVDGAGANGGVVGVVDVSKIGVKNLDPQVRAQLEQVRTSLELFYDAAKRVVQP
jgi:hypothetical protein